MATKAIQRRSGITAAQCERPRTRKALAGYLRGFFGLAFPARSFTPGNSTPFDFIADAFFEPGQDLAAWANRSGLKTLAASVILALEFRWAPAPIQARVLAGSEDQARNLYRYFEDWCWRVLRDRIQDRPGRLLTRLDNGALEVLAASTRRVRGAKVQRLVRDEIDEMDSEVFNASVGMLAGLPDRPARIIDLSTWHRPHGLMQDLVNQADERGIKLHRWAIWETIARCPRERHRNGAGCRDCPLGSACLRKAREWSGNPGRQVGIAAEADGLIPIDDAIRQRRQWSEMQWDAEAECERPSVEGLVYPQFDHRVHVTATIPDRLQVYRAIDFGYGVFVCLWLGVDPKTDYVYVLDTYKAEQATLRTHGSFILAHRLDKARATYCDPAGRNRNDQTGRSAIDELRDLGIPCRYTLTAWAREVKNGIDLIRGALKPALGPPRLYVVRSDNNRALIRDLESYCNRKVNAVWIDEPQKPQAADHTCDALRYFYVNRYPPYRGGVRYMGYT